VKSESEVAQLGPTSSKPMDCSRPGSAEKYAMFANVQPIEFRRVVSNLVNNAVEAMDMKGTVAILLNESRHGDDICIQVIDKGKGIPKHILPKLMERGKSFGKKNGLGLGLSHAKNMIERWNGRFSLESELGHGTVATIIIGKSEPPDWFVSALIVAPNQKIAILDDDCSIHQTWINRFADLDAEKSNISVDCFQSVVDYRNWAKMPENIQAVHLIDFEFVGNAKNGIEIINELGIQENSVLVTSRYAEKEIRNECYCSKIRMIPKPLAGFVPIVIESENSIETIIGSHQIDKFVVPARSKIN